MIYIREAHPGEEIQQPETWEERREIASNFMSSVNLTIPALIDEIDNRTEIDYRGWPDRLYVVNVDGRVFHKGAKGPAGFDPQEIVDALEILQTATKVEFPGRLVSTWGAIRSVQAGPEN